MTKELRISNLEVLEAKDPVFHLAWSLRKAGAPIPFNQFGVDLPPQNVWFNKPIFVHDYLPGGQMIFQWDDGEPLAVRGKQ